MEELKFCGFTPKEFIAHIEHIENVGQKNYWASWYHYEEMGEFEFKDDNPCWESGAMPLCDPVDFFGDSMPVANIFVAAIRSNCFNGARDIVSAAYDSAEIGFINFRFMIIKPEGWSPFSERFPRADWMKWGGS